MRGKFISFSIVLTCVFIYLISSPAVKAQDRFDRDDMAQNLGYGGYTTYHDTLRDTNDRPHHSYEDPKPITEPLYNSSARHSDMSSPTYRDNRKGDKNDLNPQLTRLEKFYRAQTNDDTLKQFGYDLFYDRTPVIPLSVRDDKNDSVNAPMGAVQDNYVLQSGDEVTVIFMGERKDRQAFTIGSDGRLIIDGLSPVTAAGQSLGAVRNEIKTLLASYGYNGDVDISVSGIRQIGVLVAGHVDRPGRHTMNAFHSVLDALQEAGGIRKTGSLRQIKRIRNGQTAVIDLYTLLVSGQAPDNLQLQDGDRIIVPPMGPTIAVTGDVKQPGIFELRPDPRLAWRTNGGNRAHNISLTDALAMSGGVLSAGDNRFTLRMPSTQGKPQVINMAAVSKTLIGDGGILTVTRTKDIYDNAIELKGYSRKNGLYDLNTTPTLSSLLGDRTAFGDDIYPLIGIIARIDRNNLTRTLHGFSPKAIATQQDDRQLEPGDTVYLFSHADIKAIMAETPRQNDSGMNDKTAGLVTTPISYTQDKQNEEFPLLIRDYVRDSVITIQGAVRNAGAWPVGTQADLESLISVAGGLTSKAGKDNIEIVSQNTIGNTGHRRQTINAETIDLASIVLLPGDQIRINQRYEKAVSEAIRITGEVKHPGTYDLMRGDTLSSVIQRAGGLTPDAYPPGAIFSRESERKREEAKFRAAAQDLERTISINLNTKDKNADLTPQQISMARDLAEELRSIQAVGRVTVEADPAVLSARPELDLLVEGDDHLHIPKRPLNVRVSGEVMHPASLLFMAEKDKDDYLAEAGGTTYYADKGRIFVLYPDGSAQPTSNFKSSMIIPGSTIVVPRDPKPFNFMDSFKDITQILTNMAITGVFVEDIATDEN